MIMITLRCGFLLMALLVCIMTHNVCGHANLETIMQHYERSPKSWYKWSSLMSVLDNIPNMEEDYNNYENEKIFIDNKYPTAMQKFLVLSMLMDNEVGLPKNTVNEYELLDERRRVKNVKRNISRSNQIPVKAYSMKKNVQYRSRYMSPCHFKICNMGKRVVPDYSE